MTWADLGLRFAAVRDPYRELRLDYAATRLDADAAESEEWSVRGALDAAARAMVEALAAAAGRKLTGRAAGAETGWYRELTRRGLALSPHPPRYMELFDDDERIGTLRLESFRGAARASAELCAILDAETVGDAHGSAAGDYRLNENPVGAAMVARGWSAEVFAREVGCDPKTVRRYLKGECGLSAKVRKEFAQLLKVKPDSVPRKLS